MEESSKRGACPIPEESIELKLKRKIRKRRKLRIEKIQTPQETILAKMSSEEEEHDDMVATPTSTTSPVVIETDPESETENFSDNQSKDKIPEDTVTTPTSLDVVEAKRSSESVRSITTV